MIRYVIGLILVFKFNAEAQSSALELGNNLFAKGNYSKAIAAFEEHDDIAEVYDKIAKSYLALGLTKKALEYYEKSYNTNAEDELITYEYAKQLLAHKELKEAHKLFNTLIYKDYRNPNYHYQQGLVLEKMKDSMEIAMNRFKSAFDLDNTHQKSIIKLAKYYIKKRKHKLVDRYIDSGFESFPDSPVLISLKAQNFYWKEDYVNAIKWFEKLVAMNETSEFIHEKLSLSYGKEYQYEKAIKNRKEVLKYNPTDVISMYVIGQYYQKLQNHAEAEKWIKQYLALSDIPLDAEYTNLGMSYNYQKKYKEAIDAFKMALRENPKNTGAQFFLAVSKDTYYEDYDAKIKVYEDFKKKYPKSPFISYAERRISELKKEKFLEKE